MFQQHKLSKFNAIYNQMGRSLGVKFGGGFRLLDRTSLRNSTLITFIILEDESTLNVMRKRCWIRAENDTEREQIDDL